MHRTKTTTVRSVVSKLQMSVSNVLAWYDTLIRFSPLIQTAYQSTVLLQKARTVQAHRTF